MASTHTPDTKLSEQIIDAVRPKLAKIGSMALPVGVVGLVLSLVGAFMPDSNAVFFRSWLFSFMFWSGLTGGSLAWLMVHHVTGGGWGFIARRPLEAATRCLPVVIICFIPIVIPMLMGHGTLYPWADPVASKGDELIAGKAIWLNTPGFIIRAVIYFGLFAALTVIFNKWSRELDEHPECSKHVAHKLSLMGPPGLIIYSLVLTAAGVDWVMSQDPHWYSSLYGGLLIAGQALAAMSFLNIMIGVLSKDTDLLKNAPRKYLGDLGNFNMAFTLLWGYLNFSQWLIMYAANLPEEGVWFLQRTSHGWQYMGGSLIVLQFILPFLTLAIGTNIKREPHRLKYVAGLILFMRAVDTFWYVIPTHREHIGVHWLDVTTFVGIGGIWLWMYTKELAKAKTWVAVNDPRLHGEWPPHAGQYQDTIDSSALNVNAGVEENRPAIGGAMEASNG